MTIILEILTAIACILLILVVLVQDSKGGGLSSSFGGSNQILGVRKTTDFLEKATWVLAIAILVLSLASSYFGGQTTVKGSGNSVSKSQADNMAIPQQQQRQAAPVQQAPATSAPAPANGGNKKP